MRHSLRSITLVSFQKAAADVPLTPAFLASMNWRDSGNARRIRPTAMEKPAPTQNMIFQLLVPPPIPRLTHAART